MRSRRDAGARRGAGLLLAVVLVASQASAWFHAVAISHVACAEHGEAIHRTTPAAADVHAARGSARTVSADLATVSGHDHCANAALLRWRDVALTAPAKLAAFDPSSQSTEVRPAYHAVLSAAVYRLAPKTSPPASA